jgi:signal transduction histidine kinase
MNRRLQELYRSGRRRYFWSAMGLLVLGASAITSLWGILAARTYGLTLDEAVVPVAITIAQGGIVSVLVLLIRRAEIRAITGWDPTIPSGVDDPASRSRLLHLVLRLPWRIAVTAVVIGPLVAGPTIFAAFAGAADFDFDDVLLGIGGGLLGVLYVAAYTYGVWELVLGPLRAELGMAITREQRDRIGSLSLMAKFLVSLAITAVVLSFIAGVLIADPDSSFAEGGRIVLIAVGAAVIVGGSLGIPLAKGALAPIDHLIDGTRSVAAGDLATRVPLTSTDEFADLVLSFNEMVEGLAERERLRGEKLALVDELRASRSRIVAAADESRRHVERDLHDGAQQSLVLLNLKLGMAERKLASDPEEAASILAAAREDLNRALDELRDLAHGIYPQVLTSDGLGSALEEVTSGAEPPISISAEGTGRYPEEVEAAVYFCCLEALQNAGKYAGERAKIQVRLSEGDGALRFEVADDGAGFEVASVNGSAGLQNMADRIGALGGELRVESAPGSGTRVAGSVPLAR